MNDNNDVKGINTEGYRPNLTLYKFEGSTPIEEWLVDARYNVSFIDESRRAAFIKIHLRGDDRIEMLCGPIEIQNNVEKIFEVMEDVFGKKKTRMEIMQEIWDKIDEKDTGTISKIGHSGSVGATGKDGVNINDGNSVEKGSIRDTGNIGDTGNDGKNGNEIKHGVEGEPGATSITKNDGKHGIDGDDGSTGETGLKEEICDQGGRGFKENIGSDGNTGRCGLKRKTVATCQSEVRGGNGLLEIDVEKGDTGSTGIACREGIRDITGSTGVVGTRWKVGIRGNSGMHGPTGFIGSTGLESSNQRYIITARDTRYIQRETHPKRFKIQNYWEEDRWRVKPD